MLLTSIESSFHPCEFTAIVPGRTQGRPKCALIPVSTTRVNGPNLRMTSFHYPSTRAVLTGARFSLGAGVFTACVGG